MSTPETNFRLTDLSVDQRLKAYQLARDLKRRGMRTCDIATLIKRRGFPVKYETIRTWVAGIRNPIKKLNTVKSFDGNLVELIGMSIGDGNWHKILSGRSCLGGRISYASLDLELATRAGRLMALIMKKPAPYRPFWSRTNHVYIVACGSKHLVEILNEALARLRSLIWLHRVRFVRGIYNAEGSITVRLRNQRIYPRIYLTNSDSEVLELTRKILNSIGIRTTIELNTKAGKRKTILGVNTMTRADVYNICIGTRNGVLKFARLVGFGIERKKELLGETIRQLRKEGRD